MSGEARVAAQAKVNLALRVLARDASGYHAIETIFARLDLADDIVVRVGGSTRSVDVHGALWTERVPAERNLAYRAALAYHDETGWPGTFAIEIEKRIPLGGGLGGGSADAGAVLRALDALAPRPLGDERLAALAASLGADVPFLAGRVPLALATGRGEKLLALPALPEADVRLIFPQFAVRTPDAYGWIDESRAAPDAPRAATLVAADARSWSTVSRVAENDFERVVGARHPEIEQHLAALRDAGADIALMSGSGSTLFGVWHSRSAPAHGVSASVATRTASRVVPVEVRE